MIIESITSKCNIGDKDFIYYYNLIKNDLSLDGYDESDESISIEAYGIEILREEYEGGEKISVLSDSIKYISPQKEKVKNLMVDFKNNMVSPIHLVDVAEEFIDEYIVDFDDVYKEKVNSIKQAKSHAMDFNEQGSELANMVI